MHSAPTLPEPLREIAARARRVGLILQPCDDRPSSSGGVRVSGISEGLWAIDVTCHGATARALLGDRRAETTPPGTLVVADAPAEATRLAEALRWALEDTLTKLENDTVLNDFCEKLAQSYEETYTLFRALRLLASREEPLTILRRLTTDIQRTLPFDWLAIQFAGDDRVVPALRGQLVVAGDAPTERRRLGELAQKRLLATPRDSWTKVLAPNRDEMAAFAGTELVCEPVTHDDRVIASLFAGGKSGDDAEIASPEIQFLDATADFLGTFHENMARFDEQRAMTQATLESLVAAIDAKDAYTCGHSERVAMVAGALARSMGIDESTCERIRLSGLVHDVGKIGVPEAILTKPGKPTDEEFAAIRRHPEIGHHILHGIAGFEDLLPGVLHHHERWDGKGYPHRLSGEDIPLFARIIGLADAFDAMSSTRSYRAALPRERVLEEIRKGAGSQFDPTVAIAFQRVDLGAYDAMLAAHAGNEPVPKLAKAA